LTHKKDIEKTLLKEPAPGVSAFGVVLYRLKKTIILSTFAALTAVGTSAQVVSDEPDVRVSVDSVSMADRDPSLDIDIQQKIATEETDSLSAQLERLTAVTDPFSDFDIWEERKVEFNPSPTRAVWMSALFPGLGQLYNRRYWKLPIIVGGFLGLGYATSWNNSMLTDYQRAYRDIMDNDPSSNSYMDFFPPTTKESDLDTSWLSSLLKSRKDFYRRNRDLCIICMVGVYFLAMIDAYVDASLSHFDISPDLSMDVVPSLIQDTRAARPGIGLTWALTF
jgi:hypothetical protein